VASAKSIRYRGEAGLHTPHGWADYQFWSTTDGDDVVILQARYHY
jgi:Txe/YoeB family toxin of Txe-Axe toxin-antitoxin module